MHTEQRAGDNPEIREMLDLGEVRTLSSEIAATAEECSLLASEVEHQDENSEERERSIVKLKESIARGAELVRKRAAVFERAGIEIGESKEE